MKGLRGHPGLQGMPGPSVSIILLTLVLILEDGGHIECV